MVFKTSKHINTNKKQGSFFVQTSSNDQITGYSFQENKSQVHKYVHCTIFIGVWERWRLIYFIGNVRWGLLRIKYIPSSIGVWLLAFHGAWRAFWFNNICYSDIIFSVLCWPCKHGHISGLQFVREICVQTF